MYIFKQFLQFCHFLYYFSSLSLSIYTFSITVFLMKWPFIIIECTFLYMAMLLVLKFSLSHINSHSDFLIIRVFFNIVFFFVLSSACLCPCTYEHFLQTLFNWVFIQILYCLHLLIIKFSPFTFNVNIDVVKFLFTKLLLVFFSF